MVISKNFTEHRDLQNGQLQIYGINIKWKLWSIKNHHKINLADYI